MIWPNFLSDLSGLCFRGRGYTKFEILFGKPKDVGR